MVLRKRLRKKISVLLGTLGLCMILGSGCSQKIHEMAQEIPMSTETEDQNPEEDKSDYESIFQESEKFPLLEGNWQGTEDITNPDYYMSVSVYDEQFWPVHEKSTSFSRGSCVDGNKLYYMRVYYDENDNYSPTYYLDILDSNTLEIETITYRENAYLYDITVSAGRVFTYQDERENGTVVSCKIVELLPDGTIKEMGELFSILEEAEMIPEPQYALDVRMVFDAFSEKVYLFFTGHDEIYITDLAVENTRIFKGLGERKETLEYLCNTHEGVPLFMSYDSAASKCRIFIFSGDEPQVLFTADSKINSSEMSVDCKGNLIYRSFDGASIICWNPRTGIRERVVIAAYNSLSGIDGLVRNEKGEILAVAGFDNILRKYSFSGPARSVTITVDSLWNLDDECKRMFRQYESTHPGIRFQLPKDKDINEIDADVYTSRLFTEISEGKGADILLMTSNDYAKLVEKGCLMEISDIFTQEKRQEILPQILDMGKVGDRQYAAYLGFDMNLVEVNRKIWGRETWTIEDVLHLIDERKKEGNPFEYLCVYSFGYIDNALGIFTYDLENSGWIDYEKGTCNFNNDIFRHLLEVCKEYYPTDGQRMERSDVMEDLLEGRILCVIDSGGFITYSNIMADSGEQVSIVGCPTNMDSGNIIRGDIALTVNKNTTHYDIIRDFIDTVYSFDYMGYTSWGVPYSLSLYDHRIETPNDLGKEYLDSPVIRLDRRTCRPIPGKADGESYLAEYKDVLQKSRVFSRRENEIFTIIYEEAEQYAKDASMTSQEVANRIQDRVQIYMAEHY